MPVEIRELVVKTILTDPDHQGDQEDDEKEMEMKDSIIKTCVDEVMRILEQKSER